MTRPARPDRVSRRAFLQRGGALAAGTVLSAPGAAGAAAAGGIPAADAAAPPASEPLRLARVWFDGDAGGRFDTTHRVFDDGSVEVLLWPGDLARLQQFGVRHEVTVTDLAAHDTARRATAPVRPAGLALQPGETADGEYRRLADYQDDLRALAEAHPDRARLFELPHVTFESRRVLALEIATGVHGPPDGRPTFHVDGVHHAREWPASEMAIMFAYDLLESYGDDPRATALVDQVRTVVVPVVNPDGFHHSREAAAETPGGTAEGVTLGGRGAYWRKNRRSFSDYFAGDGLVLDGGHRTYPEQIQGFDAYGVDPNRNYACTWGTPGSSANDVHSQSHRGDAPFSEPETRNIAWLMTTRHITGSMTHHTYAGEIIWPWSNLMGEAPDAALMADLGAAMARHNGYRARKYNTSEGTTPDHFYGSVSSLSFLFEHGSQFHPPYLSYIPGNYASNREAFLLLAEETCLLPEQRAPQGDLPAGLLGPGGSRRLHHAVLRGRVVDAGGNGVPARLATRKRYQSLLWLFGDGSAPGGRTTYEECFEAVIHTGPDGRFTWHVNPSTRPHVALDGATEAYELAVLSPAGGTAREITVGRGDVLDLGDLPVV